VVDGGKVMESGRTMGREAVGGRTLSTKPGRQSTEGYAQGSDLSVDRCASYELDGDARRNEVFVQVRPP
jgi:hypothetical protein